jgi:hypothetical protein
MYKRTSTAPTSPHKITLTVNSTPKKLVEPRKHICVSGPSSVRVMRWNPRILKILRNPLAQLRELRGSARNCVTAYSLGHFASTARITDSDLSMLYARASTLAPSTRPDFPLPAGRGGHVSKYKSTTR